TYYWYLRNAQGDVTGIVDSSGARVVTYTYDAWGNPLSQSTAGSTWDDLADLNPLRYRGYVYDSETGLYYLQSRYYDPEICRFINADGYASTGQGLLGGNAFAYCNNNPIVFADPTGELLITTIILIASIALGVGAAGYTAYNMRKAGYDWADTLFYSIGSGLAVFGTVYTFGMTAYAFYCNMCAYNGYLPVTHVGNPEKDLQRAADNASNSVDGYGHVAGTKKHSVYSQNVNDIGNSRLGTEVSVKDGQIVKYGEPDSIRFDTVYYDRVGRIVRGWDYKTGSAILTQSRISEMTRKSGLSIPISMIK
ncbi:MAG: RHS repeat-associated core domain-containing protein, partial [Oscillospiraceae bacterium]|nr:RHS repeat-associated core domain-containing protein [Oscillospiraceae bacterium]